VNLGTQLERLVCLPYSGERSVFTSICSLYGLARFNIWFSPSNGSPNLLVLCAMGLSGSLFSMARFVCGSLYTLWLALDSANPPLVPSAGPDRVEQVLGGNLVGVTLWGYVVVVGAYVVHRESFMHPHYFKGVSEHYAD